MAKRSVLPARVTGWFTPARRGWLRKWTGRAVKAGVVVAVVLGLVTLGSNWWLRARADGHIFSVQTVPAAPVALVFGAQVYDDGEPSPFLAARLDIARQLYEAGKVRAILVSGDNMRHEYDEPTSMQRWLVAHGVPQQKVVLDYAGFDTYDTCARAIRIFGVKQAVLVTQSFHIKRAVTLCRHLGLDATGVGDDTMRQFRQPWTIGQTREYAAADKAAFDVLTGRDPVFLGKHETGVEDALAAS